MRFIEKRLLRVPFLGDSSENRNIEFPSKVEFKDFREPLEGNLNQM